MARNNFYNSKEYKQVQSEKTRIAWLQGFHDHQRSVLAQRKCKREECQNYFRIKSYNPKIFCSQGCAAIYNNKSRGSLSQECRLKISKALKGRMVGGGSKAKGKILVPRLVKKCLYCGKQFETERWRNRKYCDGLCSIKDIGSRRTSPKAAKGKNGIRTDINPETNFYSRWEANFARVLNFLKIKWEFQPKTFDLGSQKYTPDFYLPEHNTYIEIKNFLSDYSRERDTIFRELYPNEKLILILKLEYLKLQEQFSSLIENWEFS